MKRILFAILFILGTALSARSQSTTVSGTVTDTGAQTWNGGSYSFQLIANPNFPNLASYTWTGGALTQTIRGSLDGSGAYSQSLPSNSAISPQGSKWVLIACPLATSSCASSANTTITGGAQTLNLTPPVIAINLQSPDQFVRAYADSEIITAFIGGQYYNLTSGLMRDCTTVVGQACTVWANVGAGVTSVCGANTQIQFNDAGACGADAGLTYNKTTKSFVATGGASSDSFMSAIGAGGGLNFVEVLAAGTNIAAQGTNAPVDIFASGDVSLVPGAGKSVLVGAQGTVSGVHKYFGTTSGSASFGVADIAGTPARINLPIATGTNGQFLKTDGGTPQQTSWATASATPAGATTNVQYNLAGAFAGDSGLTYVGGANPALAVGAGSGSPTFTINGNGAPSTAGNVRLSSNITIGWRNVGNTANLLLAHDQTTDFLTYSGTPASAGFQTGAYATLTNCSVNSVSPAACASAAAGSFVVPTTTTAYTVNTTRVTAASRIFLFPHTDTRDLPGAPTCVVPAITAEPVVSAIVAGTSFSIAIASTTGQTCWDYHIIN